jgi:predicted DNA-binding protein
MAARTKTTAKKARGRPPAAGSQDDEHLEAQLVVRVWPFMAAEINELARIEGRPVSNMVRHLIEAGLREWRARHADAMEAFAKEYSKRFR